MTTAPADQLLHPVQRLLDGLAAALEEAGDPLLVGLSDRELDRALTGLEAVISQLAVRQAGLVAEARARNRAGAGGAVSHTRWLSLLLRADPADAARRVRHAAVLAGGAVDPVTGPVLTDARDGLTLLPQAVIAARALASLPADLPAGGRAAAGAVMRQAARELDPARLGRVADRLLEVADPDGADARLATLLDRQDRQAHQLRSFHLGRPVHGMVRGRFTLPTDDAELLRAAIDALTAPRTSTDTTPSAAETPTTDPAAPDTDTEAAGGADPGDDPFGGPATGAADTAGPAVPADTRTPTQRRADALTDLAARALATDLPDSGGHRPNLYLTIDLDHLRAAHPGRTLDGTPLAPAVLRRTACDAGIIPAVLGSAGQPLDIGRDTRTVPTGLRRALTLRDHGCAFPGCDRPPGWTDAHHITHWADGGDTKLSNLVLLCRHHHRLTHHQPWTVRIGPDGHPRWQPPPRTAPPGTWLTNRDHWSP